LLFENLCQAQTDKIVPLDLSPIEARILGCLLEKERITPEYYPLSLNSLVTGCNQTTNRDPIVSYSENTVEQGLDLLRQKKLAMLTHTAGARVAKYRHTFLDLYNLNSREVAIICVLILRGPQTPGELRSRTERMCGAMTLSEVEALLDELSAGDDPLVKVIPPRPGQKEKRYVHLLSRREEAGEPTEEPTQTVELTPQKSRLDQLETELNTLRAEMNALREDFEQFKKQFG
jgi:uncharacterized protein YceH (UPF0502 family)